MQVRLIQRWEFMKENKKVGKQESRRTRKHAFDQESDHEKRKKIAKKRERKQMLSPIFSKMGIKFVKNLNI